MIIKNLCGYHIAICSKCDDLVDKMDEECQKCGHYFTMEEETSTISQNSKEVVKNIEE